MGKVKRPEMLFEDIGLYIDMYMRKRHMTAEELGKKAAVCRATVYNRINNPRDLTLAELRRFYRGVDMPKEILLEVLAANL